MGDLVEGERVTNMAAGWDFSLLLTESGEMLAAGSNVFGQLGVGDVNLKKMTNFVKVPDLSDIVILSAGLRHAGCVDSRGRVFTWGAGTKGQLGGGDKIKVRPTPALVPGLSEAVHITC